LKIPPPRWKVTRNIHYLMDWKPPNMSPI
jgi:hypothetical protein